MCAMKTGPLAFATRGSSRMGVAMSCQLKDLSRRLGVRESVRAGRAEVGRRPEAQGLMVDLCLAQRRFEGLAWLATNAARCSPVRVDFVATRAAGVPSNTIRPPS